MKKNAFTLIELLAVIVIIGILSTIAFIVVDKTIKDNKEKLYNVQLNNIYDATQMWTVDNMDILRDKTTYCISLNILQENNYIDKNIKNPKTDKEFDGNLKIVITDTINGYDYTLDENNICN
ncbi:MAG: type II secretion system GspH family protein [Clostridium sp.]|nr:type II secretion system GspH family protein [Clostridium sp.]MCM1444652.1 type II secretion system GspH family protein [Candidatus Amulumruptor caecigallinarius]